MRTLTKQQSSIAYSRFNDQAVLFCTYTGQTHLLDENAIELIELIPANKSISDALIKSLLSEKYPEDDKALLSEYITDIINNLVELEIIREIQ